MKCGIVMAASGISGCHLSSQSLCPRVRRGNRCRNRSVNKEFNGSLPAHTIRWGGACGASLTSSIKLFFSLASLRFSFLLEHSIKTVSLE